MKKTITVFKGDGIGPEITDAVLAILQAAQAPLAYEVYSVGIPLYEQCGELISEEAFASFERNKVLLKSPITTPIGSGFRSINVLLRKKYDLYANVRPAKSNPAIATPFPDVDIVTFRENTEIVIGHAVFSEKENPACSFALFQMMEDTLQYTGFALRGKAFAGRQSLIAYRKSSFLEHQGYSDSYALDCEGFDSFRKRIPDPSAIRVQLAPGSEVKYTGTLSFKKMLEQKRQYRTALAASPRGIRNEITAYWIMDFLYWVFFFGSVFHFFARSLAGMPESFPLWAGLSALAIIGKYAVQAAILQKAGKSTGYGTCWFALPLYDILSLSLHLALIPRRKRGR